MSLVKIRSILESAIVANTPIGVETAYENTAYVPKATTPYQALYLITAKPMNARIGDSSYREQGFMQITLRYPLGSGSGEIANHVDNLREAFKRGTVLSNNLDIIINQTPEVRFVTESDRYTAVIKIYFYCDIFQT